MTWTPSKELEGHAQLEITRLRNDTVTAQRKERQRLADDHAATGTLNSGSFLSDVEQDCEKRLLLFSSNMVELLVELGRLSGVSPSDDFDVWVGHNFEQHVVTLGSQLFQSIYELRQERDVPAQSAWDQMNNVLSRARTDKDIALGRIRLGKRNRRATDRQETAKLLNRDELDTDLDQLLQNDVPVSVLIIDLDGFKQVNDTKGHLEGDRCLQHVSAVLLDAAKGKGKVYRYGSGDEFVVVLPYFDLIEGAATSERIRRAIIDSSPGGDVPVTASIGVAKSGSELATRDALIHAADKALYFSKEKGKNRVTCWPLSEASSELGADAKVTQSIELLIAEIDRNLALKGRNTGNPERQHLEEMIALAEHDDWNKKRRELLHALYELRSLTDELTSLANYPHVVRNQHAKYYSPRASRARKLLQDARGVQG